MRALNEAEEESTITLTSLIDVVFLLLIFFLVGTTFYKGEKDLTVSLPSAAGGTQPLSEEHRIVINVREGGLLVMDGRIVTRDQLIDNLAKAAREQSSVSVVIRGDRKAYHEDVVNILDACIRLELRNVSIAVFPIEEAAGG